MILEIFNLEIKTYMEVVSLPFEFGGSVDFVSHDARNGFFHIFHPFHHLGLAHQVDILDERIIFLPECHLGWSVKVKEFLNSVSKIRSLNFRAKTLTVIEFVSLLEAFRERCAGC